MSPKEVILHHLRGSGPVGFDSIMWYLKEQCSERVEDYQAAALLTELIREGKVCLYDDGKAFDSCADSH